MICNAKLMARVLLNGKNYAVLADYPSKELFICEYSGSIDSQNYTLLPTSESTANLIYSMIMNTEPCLPCPGLSGGVSEV